MAAFSWIREQMDRYGDVLPWSVLKQGFEWKGTRVPFVSPQGIFKPKVISSIPLTILSAPNRPYNDHFDKNNLLQYAYRGDDPNHRDNVGLRKAMAGRVPLIYLHGVVKGKYLVACPVYVVGDNPTSLTFTIAVDDAKAASEDLVAQSDMMTLDESDYVGRREYVTATFRRRLHQRAFRERVLRAYGQQCALCRLKHQELLDAAHITADSAADGEPRVTNGLALCKLHHAAYDRNFLSVRPDYVIQIRQDLLDETDGPMLQHGLKELHNRSIILPRRSDLRPDRERLSARHERFLGSV